MLKSLNIQQKYIIYETQNEENVKNLLKQQNKLTYLCILTIKVYNQLYNLNSARISALSLQE